VGEELGIDANTVCRWVREHRRKNNLPSYREEQGIVKPARSKEPSDSKRKIRELEARLKAGEKALADERENVEILKKCLHIFMQARD
jgi:transposase-like protein